MKWQASDNYIVKAANVTHFMEELAQRETSRWSNVRPACIPFGDLAYGMAVVQWEKDGRPEKAFFSWADGELVCPYLMEFRNEISKKFGLRILTQKEAKEERSKYSRAGTFVIDHKVHDWGLN